MLPQGELQKIKDKEDTILTNAVLEHYRKKMECKDLHELKDIVSRLHSLLSTLE